MRNVQSGYVLNINDCDVWERCDERLCCCLPEQKQEVVIRPGFSLLKKMQIASFWLREQRINRDEPLCPAEL